MNLQDQVCTLEQAKRLNELGVEQTSIFCWNNLFKPKIYTSIPENENEFSAFTVAELGMMLPQFVVVYEEFCDLNIYMSDGLWEISYAPLQERAYGGLTTAKTEAEARAAMLIYLLENKLITAEEVNKRLNVKAIPHKTFS